MFRLAVDSIDPIARPFHAQIALVKGLVEANRVRVAANGSHWDDWFDRVSKLPTQAQAAFPEQVGAVAAIEAAAADIVAERDKLPAIRDAAMIAKIQQLAMASSTSGLDLGERIASDFSAFSDWRKDQLDGVDLDMFSLIDQRTPSRRPPRGERRSLFDVLFIAWVKAAGAPLQEAEAAARVKRKGDIEGETALDTSWTPSR